MENVEIGTTGCRKNCFCINIKSSFDLLQLKIYSNFFKFSHSALKMTSCQEEKV